MAQRESRTGNGFRGIPDEDTAVLMITKLNHDMMEIRTSRIAENLVEFGELQEKLDQRFPAPTTQQPEMGIGDRYEYLKPVLCSNCSRETKITRIQLAHKNAAALCTECYQLRKELRRGSEEKRSGAVYPNQFHVTPEELDELCKTVHPW